jgi:hypothetical protein
VTESALLYVGASLVAASLIVSVFALRGSWVRARKPSLVVAALGLALCAYAFSAPAREISIVQPVQRLDFMMPRYHFHERHAMRVSAPPAVVDSAIRSVTADEIRLYNTLTWIRRLGRSGPPSLLDPPRGMPMLSVAARTGFQVLSDNPGDETVLGVMLPLSRQARAELAASRRMRRRLPFVASKEGYASATMNFRITPGDQGGSVVSTETRVFAPDDATRRSFARYWRIIYPGSALIRREWLAAIRRRSNTDGD